MAKRGYIGFRIASVACLAMLSVVVGCGGIETYTVDPAKASAAAIEQYDKNHDGILDETELRACPALYLERRAYDESKDKKLSADEIATQISDMYGRGSGMTSLSCTVLLDGAPLSGATVKFIPEAFLGPKIKEATGVTDSVGQTSLGISPDELPKELRRHSLMRVGIYRVEITHPTKKLQDKYNTNTELGFEFHQTNHVAAPIFRLVSK